MHTAQDPGEIVATRRSAPSLHPASRPLRTWGLIPRDATFAVLVNAVLIIGMWLRHGGLSHLHGAGSVATAIGQITALLGTYAILIEVLLLSRAPFIERVFGMDRLAGWHRVLGYASTILICAHVGFTTVGYARGDHSSITSETANLLTTYPDVMMAAVATLLILAVVVTSVRAARKRLSYETWHLVHFYSYLAVALAFAHELAVGSDFTSDALARAYWIALSAAVGLCVVLFRFGHPLMLTVRHRLRVDRIETEAPGVVSVYVTGRRLDRLPARPGQYFKWRFLTGKDGWPALPFSLSAPPNDTFLRFTARVVGRDTERLLRVHPGTRVAIEGPYGTFTTHRRTRSGALLVAGGIGITPLRAMLEELPRGAVLLYRARCEEDIVFRDELNALAAQRDDSVYYLVGSRTEVSVNPLSPRSILKLVPDVHRRDVFVCGPPGMMSEVLSSLRAIGVPDRQVHYERFTLV